MLLIERFNLIYWWTIMFKKIKKHCSDIFRIATAPRNKLLSYSEVIKNVQNKYNFAPSEDFKTYACFLERGGFIVTAVVHVNNFKTLGFKDYHVSFLAVSTSSKLVIDMLKKIPSIYNVDFYISTSSSTRIAEELKKDISLPVLKLIPAMSFNAQGYADSRSKRLYLLANTIRNGLLAITDSMSVPESFLNEIALCAMSLEVTQAENGLSVSRPVTKTNDEAIAAAVLEAIALSHYYHED